MDNETLNNIKMQLEEDYIDFGIHDKEEIELLITMVKTYENWKALKGWLEEQLMYFKENNEQGGFSDNVEDLEIVLDKMDELEKEND